LSALHPYNRVPRRFGDADGADGADIRHADFRRE
jgi:hypothetical protein